MTFLTIDGVSLSAPDGNLLFSDLSFSLGHERIGLVGRNGCGKSTLLRCLAGGQDVLRGAISVSGSIGLLEQSLDETLSLADVLGVSDALARLDRIEQGEGSGDDFDRAEWDLPAKLQKAFADLDMSLPDLEMPISCLSGGERMRVSLAKILLHAPDILLLDEPTNNLDIDGKAAVRKVMENWRGGVIVASHDRALLEHVDRIIELSSIETRIYPGGWSAFETARRALLDKREAELQRSEKALKHAQRAAQRASEKQDRRDKAGRAARAQGGQPKILLNARRQRAEATRAKGSAVAGRQVADKAERLSAAQSDVQVITPLDMMLPSCGLAGQKELLRASGLVHFAGNRRLFGPLDIQLRGPERVAIKGRNGSGKTTLLRVLSGALAPQGGIVELLTRRIAILDQHLGNLPQGVSLREAMALAQPGLSDNAVHAALARFSFRSKDAERRTERLSGGERLRAGLACIFAAPEPPELLLLDEPTNHLDIYAIEALESTLKAYDGALLVVSHDARFLQALQIDREIWLE